jgi:hypothetical protein
MTKNVNEVLHYPRLDTVLMVEEAIKNAKEYSSKRQLWLSLKKKVMYQTFNIVIDYLVESNKVVIDKEGKVIWIWDPEGVKKYMKEGVIIR